MKENEIIEKAFEAYPYISNQNQDGEWHDGPNDKSYKERKGYIKALEEFEELPKIHGWVARDECTEDDTNLFFGRNKPRLGGDHPFMTWCDFGDFIGLPKELFPELKFEDGPIEVELLIRKKL